MTALKSPTFIGLLLLCAWVATAFGVPTERQTKGDAFSRIYRGEHDDDDNGKNFDGQYSRNYRSQQPSFSRILRTGTFSRILRSSPSFSRILRSGSLSRILRSDADQVTPSDEKESRMSRLLRSQSFSRILKRSQYPEEEYGNDSDIDDEVDKRSNINDFTRILRSSPSFSRIL